MEIDRGDIVEDKKEFNAIAKYVRISPYKIRRVARLMKGLPYKKADNLLKALPQRGAILINKVLKSATYNAVNTHGANLENIVVQSVNIDEGPRLMRYKARARGRIYKIIKRTCHIRVTVIEQNGGQLNGTKG